MNVAQLLRVVLGCCVDAIIVVPSQPVCIVVAPSQLVRVLHLLANNAVMQYKSLLDVWCVDYPASTRNRFQINYLLAGLYGCRVIVRISIADGEPIDSVTGLYASAGWLEREVWDLFGVYFKGHPDLRRILTDYGFNGYPLRKDFPLTGYFELRYDDTLRRVVVEPVELSQEYRYFDYLSPWEKQS